MNPVFHQIPWIQEKTILQKDKMSEILLDNNGKDYSSKSIKYIHIRNFYQKMNQLWRLGSEALTEEINSGQTIHKLTARK